MSSVLKIALLGAESTGKTCLAGQLASYFITLGRPALVAPEALREWCQREGRAPHPEEHMAIAHEQERRVDSAARSAQVVIADTTALMVAVYGAMLFEDDSLYRFAIERQRSYDLTLLTGLDLPWVGDGLQREGPHVREPVDALLRQCLHKAHVPYRVIYGRDDERLRNALAAIGELKPASATRPWRWLCEKCSDPDCEHRLFSQLRG